MIYLVPTDTCYGLACTINDSKSYDMIYKMKKRNYSKPLVIMVENFNWLEKNTDLTSEQIDFLKKYEKPFTILTNSTNVRVWLNYENDDTKFINKEQYTRVAFRVAHNKEQTKLIKEIGPIFLTSANISDKPSIYKFSEIGKEFSYHIDKKHIKILSEQDLDEKNPPSDIFEFVGESLDINYLRKL